MTGRLLAKRLSIKMVISHETIIVVLISHIGIFNGNTVLEACCQQISSQLKTFSVNSRTVNDDSFLELQNLGLSSNIPKAFFFTYRIYFNSHILQIFKLSQIFVFFKINILTLDDRHILLLLWLWVFCCMHTFPSVSQPVT